MRMLQTAAEGLALEEGKQINRSLSALSNVVQTLTGAAPQSCACRQRMQMLPLPSNSAALYGAHWHQSNCACSGQDGACTISGLEADQAGDPDEAHDLRCTGNVAFTACPHTAVVQISIYSVSLCSKCEVLHACAVQAAADCAWRCRRNCHYHLLLAGHQECTGDTLDSAVWCSCSGHRQHCSGDNRIRSMAS